MSSRLTGVLKNDSVVDAGWGHRVALLYHRGGVDRGQSGQDGKCVANGEHFYQVSGNKRVLFCFRFCMCKNDNSMGEGCIVYIERNAGAAMGET